MKPAKVSEVKAELSKYLARVKRGEEVVITERGRPIAKLVPIPRDEDPEMARMRDLERRGIVDIHGTGRIPAEFLDRPRLKDPKGLVRKALLEEREEGR
jgi:prevent-host-death family protein